LHRLGYDDVVMAATIDSGTGIERPRAGAICYVFGVLYPLIYLFSVPKRRQERFLRFHCIQCLLLFALMCPLVWWGRLSKVADAALPILTIGWLVAMIQAQRGKTIKLPILGQIAAHLSLKNGSPIP
jgi:uncharacterized membrane protein